MQSLSPKPRRHPVDPRTEPRPSRWRGLPLVGVLAVGLLVLLAWFDVIPGGWTLRGWIEPHAQREAREWNEYRASRLAMFRLEPAPPDGAIVMFGSSTIERLPSHLFEGPVVNRGCNFEAVADLRDRLLIGVPPTAGGFVLYPASIDFRRDRSSPERTAGIVGEILERLATAFPGKPVAVVGILSEVGLDDERIALLGETNAALAALCQEHGAAFVDTARAPLTDEDGRLAAHLSNDGLHLNLDGYRHLCRWIVEDGGETGAILGGS